MEVTEVPQAEAERARKLRGLGRYTADERFDGAAFTAFVRSPHAHARIVSVDTSQAAALSGVVRILTGADCVGLGNDRSLMRGHQRGGGCAGWRGLAGNAVYAGARVARASALGQRRGVVILQQIGRVLVDRDTTRLAEVLFGKPA